MRIFASRALLPDGWAADVALTIAGGSFAHIEPHSAREPDDVVTGSIVPGMPNVHSHAFQRAMAGHAERRGLENDDFWTWRSQMYELANTLDPETLYAAARPVYEQMLRSGYTAVAEFHYIHRDLRGAWYADRAAMSLALVRAARDAGIAICLLPALYAHGGADGRALSPHQRRFATAPDDILAIAQRVRSVYASDANVVVGVCAHSLRAVLPDELRALIAGSPLDVPIHLHIAEQEAEVDDVRAVHGATPVRWLLDAFDVNKRWCLIHGTHTGNDDLADVGCRGAVVGLCPTTEANLGDGLFRFNNYFERGGWGIGSDSNVTISPFAELCLLEYGQRLRQRRRIITAAPGESCGDTLWSGAARGGAQAVGRATGTLAAGQRADLLVLADGRTDGPDPLDRAIFADHAAVPRHVMAGGIWRVRDGALIA